MAEVLRVFWARPKPTLGFFSPTLCLPDDTFSVDADLRTDAERSEDFCERLLLERAMVAEDLDGVGGVTVLGTATNTAAFGSVVTAGDAPLLLAVEAEVDLLTAVEAADELGREAALAVV